LVDAAIVADSIKNPQDQPYLMLAQGCADAAASILESAETPALQGVQIGAQCAAAVAAEAGAPFTVQAVAAALNVFLSHVKQLSAQIQFSNPHLVTAFGGSPAAKLSKARLKRIRKKLDKLKAQHR
jgi:hypothetical protein